MFAFIDTFLHRTLGRPYRLRVVSDTGAGQPVIFLHGIASNNKAWRHTIPLMPPTFRSITIDLLGFGSSPKPSWSTYSTANHADAVANTIKKMHLGQPVIIVGHSMGSLVAVELAKQHPKLVKHLVLCSMPLYSTDRTETLNSKASAYVSSSYFKIYEAIRQRPQFTLKNAERLTALAGDTTSFTLSKDTWIPFTNSLANTIENQTTMSDISRLKQPIDIIYGTLDMLVVAGNLKTVTRNNPNVRLHKVVSGHDISPKYAKKVVAVILDTSKA